MYFRKEDSASELHEKHKAWAKKLHPDAGGSQEEFQAMQQEYEDRLNALANNPEESHEGDYVLAIKFLLELAKEREPHLYRKAKAVANGVSSILDVFETPQTEAVNKILKMIVQ